MFKMRLFYYLMQIGASQILRKKREIAGGKSLDYVDRVNRAIDFILQHLDQPLPLEVVAKAASFSPFHFHRIFRLMVGESVSEFVKRLRLERAVVLMSRRTWASRRHRSLTEIALACGFDSSSDFSRCFKQRYGIPASRFDVGAFREKGREELRLASTEPRQRNLVNRLLPGENPDEFKVQLRRLPQRSVAYLRVQDSFREGAVLGAIDKLMAWAEARHLASGKWLGYMWDDPEIVALSKCRYDVGLVVPPATPGGEVSRLEFPEMQVAEVEIRGGIDLEMRALDWMFGTWLPQSGFVPTEQPCFEVWMGRPFAQGTEHFELCLHVPVAGG